MAAPGRTFGIAYKGCYDPCVNASDQQNLWAFDRELPVFSHQCQTSNGTTCLMKHLWPSGCCPGYPTSRIRYYIDGEAVASVDIPLGLGHGSSMLEDMPQKPWSAGSSFGWTGLPSKGGVFNTYPIPFAKSIRVTVVLHTSAPVGQRQHDPVGFWLILRGHAGAPAVALPGGLTVLPRHARLKVHENTCATEWDRATVSHSTFSRGCAGDAGLVGRQLQRNWVRVPGGLCASD